MTARELTNGFANRFLMIWAERSQIVPFPKATPQATVDALTHRTLEILKFIGADRHDHRDRLRMELSAHAQWHYAGFYRGELNEDLGNDLINALLERRAPMLLRLAMLFALCDLQLRVDVPHIDAAMAWIRYATASVRFVFVSATDETHMARVRELSNRVLAFLHDRGKATRSEISTDCFRGRVPKGLIDASIDHLLSATPPKIYVQWVQRPLDAPGTPTRIYHLT